MTAFDQAWKVMKAPFHGTDSDSFSRIMSEGMAPNSFAAGYEGEKGVPRHTITMEEDAMLDAWDYALNNVLSQGVPSKPHLIYINPEHPQVNYQPDNRDAARKLFGMLTLGDKGHLFSEDRIPVEAMEEVFEGDEYDPDGVESESEYYSRMMEMLEGSL